MSGISSYGQERDSIFSHKSRHEVEIGAGTPSLLFLIGSTFSYGDHIEFPINIHSQYMYNLSKHFSVGGSLTYTGYKYSYYDYIDYEEDGNYYFQDVKTGESKYYHLLTLGITGRAYWFYKKHFAMYSKYGITLSTISETHFTEYAFCPYNFSFVGIEFGGNRWRGYLEPLCLLSTWPAVHAGVKYLF